MLTRLIYFQTVAEYENFSKAAKKLDISQPALSKAMKTLEQELNTELFLRTSNTIQLNQNGHKFLNYCDQLLTVWKKAQQDLNHSQQKNIAISLQVASSHLAALLEQIHPLPSGTTLTINQKQSVTDTKLIINSQHLNPDIYDSQTVLTENLRLAVPANFMTQHLSEGPVSISTLSKLPLILLTKDYELRQTIDHFFKQFCLLPTISYEIDNPSLFRDMVNQELGMALIPQKTWFLTNASIHYLPISPCFERHLYVHTLKNPSVDDSLQSIRNRIITFFETLNVQD